MAWAGTTVDWYPTNQATIAWTPVTTMENGKPIPEGSIIKYQTYLADAMADPEKQNPIDTGIVEVAEKTFTLTTEGKYYAGIWALRYVGGELVGQSTISWSNNLIVCKDGKTFGLKHYFIPDNVMDMHLKTE